MMIKSMINEIIEVLIKHFIRIYIIYSYFVKDNKNLLGMEISIKQIKHNLIFITFYLFIIEIKMNKKYRTAIFDYF